MPFLKDDEINALVNGTSSPAPALAGLPFTTKESPIQACSLDLSIGEIYVPGTKPGDLGSFDRPRSFLPLKQGHSALLRTAEDISLPADIGGIAFPPAGVSMKGLLMTNPGHVDPGYEGRLHLTVINMGREPFPLEKGDRIARMLLFKLSGPATAPFNVRRRTPPGGYNWLNHELIDRLTFDFMDISKRAEEAASRSVLSAQLKSAIAAPILALIFGSLATIAVTEWKGEATDNKIGNLEKQAAQLETRMNSLGGQVNLGTIEARVRRLEEQGTK